MSSRPNSLTAFATAAEAALASATSAAKYVARSFSAFAVRRRVFSSWSTRSTEAPSRQNALAVAAPMPAPPPVIRATLSCRRIQQPFGVFHQDLFQHGFRKKSMHCIQQFPIIRHFCLLEYARMRPVAAPEQPPRRDLGEPPREGRDVVVGEALFREPVGAADLGPEVLLLHQLAEHAEGLLVQSERRIDAANMVDHDGSPNRLQPREKAGDCGALEMQLHEPAQALDALEDMVERGFVQFAAVLGIEGEAHAARALLVQPL